VEQRNPFLRYSYGLFFRPEFFRSEMLERQSLLPFPMPEFELSDLLGRAEIGTLKQAMPAAKNAVLFMQAVYSGQRFILRTF